VCAWPRSRPREGSRISRSKRALDDVLHHEFAPGESDLVAEALAQVQYHDVPAPALLALTTATTISCSARWRRAGRRGQTQPRLGSTRGPSGRLCIGYLSADFRAHVMGELLLPVIEAHDRRAFASRSSRLPRPECRRRDRAISRATDAFVELAALDDAAAANAIATQAVDVLVDLMGHSAFARPAILARKPARRIVTHLGYHGAVGLRSVDWKITDAVADLPDGAARCVSGCCRSTSACCRCGGTRSPRCTLRAPRSGLRTTRSSSRRS
jgi:predicted O-linked N-acetylglucosamine transferase (SPINDLY family)